MKFVIQEHRSRERIRYYLRLEKDGLLKSWAVPKGLPEDWGTQRLAIQVGDFDLGSADFEGEIKKGKFGPGSIAVWDKGDYKLREWSAEEIIFTLSGSQTSGAYALIRFQKAGDRRWLLGRTKDRVPSGTPKAASKSITKSPPKKRRPSSTITKHRTKSITPSRPQYKTIKKKPLTRERWRKPSTRYSKRWKPTFKTGYSKRDFLLLIIFTLIGLIFIALIIFTIAILTV